jgi:hypothetical protein
MNDTEVINEVRARFGEVHMTMSLDTVVARGRTLRRRKKNRRRAAMAVAAAAVALVDKTADYRRIFPFTNHPPSGVAFDINPSAIPRGAALWIEVSPETETTSGTVTSSSFGMRATQVYTGGQCPAPGRR